MELKLTVIKLVLIFQFVWASAIAAGDVDVSMDPATEQLLMKEYPGLFKTGKDVQRILHEKKQHYKMKQLWETLGSASRAISRARATLSSISAGAKEFETVYHACCITDRDFDFFTELRNQKGEKVRLVQMAARKQWFLVDTCETFPGCSRCTCTKEPRLYTALIHNPDYPTKAKNRFMMSFVEASTVCRCINQDPHPSRVHPKRFGKIEL